MPRSLRIQNGGQKLRFWRIFTLARYIVSNQTNSLRTIIITTARLFNPQELKLMS